MSHSAFSRGFEAVDGLLRLPRPIPDIGGDIPPLTVLVSLRLTTSGYRGWLRPDWVWAAAQVDGRSEGWTTESSRVLSRILSELAYFRLHELSRLELRLPLSGGHQNTYSDLTVRRRESLSAHLAWWVIGIEHLFAPLTRSCISLFTREDYTTLVSIRIPRSTYILKRLCDDLKAVRPVVRDLGSKTETRGEKTGVHPFSCSRPRPGGG